VKTLGDMTAQDVIYLEDDIDIHQMKDMQRIKDNKEVTEAKNRAHVLEILDDLP